MSLYAHARIEDHATGKVYDRGDTVPAKIEGRAELEEAGSLSTARYEGDPVAEAATEARITSLEHELEQLRAGDSGSAADQVQP